jgi:hypothetical protein
MAISFKYKCPPGTGNPKELSITVIAINNAAMHRFNTEIELLLDVVFGIE